MASEHFNRRFMSGWVCAVGQDQSGRRGLWYRGGYGMEETVTPLEMCSGREGDDSYVKLEVGQTITPELLRELQDILDTQHWVLTDMAGLTPEQLVEWGAISKEDVEKK